MKFVSLVDTGAEVNVIDYDLAMRAKIQVNNTKEVAQAANKLPLDVVGQSKSPVSFHCLTQEGKKLIFLGIVLIVSNLGVECLIGEPGKAENDIACLPRQNWSYWQMERKYIVHHITLPLLDTTLLELSQKLPFYLQTQSPMIYLQT